MAVALPTSSVSEELTARIEKAKETLHNDFFDAFAKAQIGVDPEKLRKEIVEDLTSQRRELALKLIGFTDHWGKMQVDSNRGDSMISKFISQQVEKAVKQWMDENFRAAVEEKAKQRLANKTVINTLVREFDEVFERELRRKVRHLAERSAAKFVTDLERQIRDTFSFSDENE